MAARKPTTTKSTTKAKTTTAKKLDPTPAQIPAPQTKSQKPVIGVGAIITLVIFAGLVLVAVFMNQKKEALVNLATPTSGPGFVFDSKSGVASNIKVQTSAGDAVEVARDAKNAWGITLPFKAEADQGLVEAAASQVSTLQLLSEVSNPGSLDIYGLDKPAYTITVMFADQKPHTLEIGDSTPTNSGYYVRLDKGKIMVVDLSGIDALTNLMTPPYLNTPTPSPFPPTETPVPPAATVTPTP
ncbi:MAG: DUF4340 domain-containing protein [Anaerolineales bacterium]